MRRNKAFDKKAVRQPGPPIRRQADIPLAAGTQTQHSPQTGDTSDMFLWIALLLVSGGL